MNDWDEWPQFQPRKTETIAVGILVDIQAISTDSAQLATDTAALAALQTSIDADTAAIAADTATVATANQTLSTDLQTSGPVFVTNADGSISVYQFSATAPGYTITKAVPAT
jgi:hypothetical protein